MIKRQTARFLFRTIPGPDRVFMAASSSSSSLLLRGSFNTTTTTTTTTADPFSRGFHFLPLPSSSSPSPAKLPINISTGFHGGVSGLTLKSCSDHQKKSVDINSVPKARALDLAPYPPLLLRHLKIGLEEGGNRDHARLPNGRGVFQRGSPQHSLPEKIVVAVDVDEVLGNFISALNRFIADRYSLNHSVSEYHVYEFFKIWNCSRDEADVRVHEFFKTSYFKTGIHPIPGARQALNKLSKFCNLSVVTSRQNAIKDQTVEWIENHYPRLFQEIHFGNHFALDGESRPKSDICRSLGAKVLIDDNPRYAIECAEEGIRVLLFDYENSYPWSKSDSIEQHPLVTKVHNWVEVEQQLVSWIVS